MEKSLAQPGVARVQISFPADVDTDALRHVILSALGSDDGGISDAPDSSAAKKSRRTMEIVSVSKASLAVDFQLKELPGGTAVDTAAMRHVSHDAVAEMLSGKADLKQALSRCVGAIAHRETHFQFGVSRQASSRCVSRTGSPLRRNERTDECGIVDGMRDSSFSKRSECGASSSSAYVTPHEFERMVSSGMLTMVDAALFAAVEEVCRGDWTNDDSVPTGSASSVLPPAAMHRAMLESFARNVWRRVFFADGCHPPAAIADDRSCGTHRSPSPVVLSTVVDGEGTRSNHGSVPSNANAAAGHCLRVASRTQREPTDASLLLQPLTAEWEALRAEVASIRSAKEEAEQRSQQLEQELRVLHQAFSSQSMVLCKAQCESSEWKRRASEAEHALMLPFEQPGNDNDDGSGLDSVCTLSQTSLTTADARLASMLKLRESQVGQLNQQLTAARKELLELKKRNPHRPPLETLGNDRIDEATGGARRSASCSSFSCASATSSSESMVPKAAVVALEARCQEAEQALRERTLQMAQLLKERKEMLRLTGANQSGC